MKYPCRNAWDLAEEGAKSMQRAVEAGQCDPEAAAQAIHLAAECASRHTLVKCRICDETMDPDEEGVSDDQGRWTHEACQDAEDEAIQNELDHDPIEFEFQG